MRRALLRGLAIAILMVFTLGQGCEDDPPPPQPPQVRPDIEGSLAGVPNEGQERIRTCLDELARLLPELVRQMGWNLEGKTITVRLADMGPNIGAETLPGAEANSVVITFSRRFCDWSASKRRMALAHELDHARTLDDPAFGDQTKSRRTLRADAVEAERVMNTTPAGTPTDEMIRRKREQVRTELEYLEARIREEERAYTAADTYGQGQGVEEKDLAENRAEKERVLKEMRAEAEKLRKTLKSLGG
jgi:hypothetical protein